MISYFYGSFHRKRQRFCDKKTEDQPLSTASTFSKKRFLNIPLLSISLVSTLFYGCNAGNGDGLDANGQPISNNGGAIPTDGFNAVQEVFNARCTTCHSGANAPQGLQLSEGVSFDALVGVPSTQQEDVLLVNPGNADESYLVQKIRGDAGITGARMPFGGPVLSDSQISTVVDWVNDGALPPSEAPELPNDGGITLESFSEYRSWDDIDYTITDTVGVLGPAHRGNVENFTRRVFANELAVNSTTGDYPEGAILVKEIVTYEGGSRQFAEVDGLLAMVKREPGFSESSRDWEWFAIAPDFSTIEKRGPDVNNGGCSACHTLTDNEPGARDFVFVHPSEYIAEDDESFIGYSEWFQIDESNAAVEELNGSAHGADISGTTRRVYKKQQWANPVMTGYPIGTVIVQEVLDGDNIIEVTGMVKRGSDFNPDNGFWEWFVIDAESETVLSDAQGNPLRGAQLSNNSCNQCHSDATPDNALGIDHVFRHDDDPFNNNSEFVATVEDFENYLQWESIDYSIGDTNAAIGQGHQGDNDVFSRRVYQNDVAESRSGNRFPQGSILIKEITTWETGEREFAPELGLVAMVKRGGNFNIENNGWEWFDLFPTADTILGRGGDFRNNGCNNCHRAAEGQEGGVDYVFEHPSEFIAENRDFVNYREWVQVDERDDRNPLLGVVHGSTQEGSIRRVYKKQAFATPEDERFGYPIGTIYLKEVQLNNEVIEITVMAKRGGSFNDENQNWEWLMLDPSSTQENPQIATIDGNLARGANLAQDTPAYCNGCHNVATGEGSTNGSDYVFFHPQDPTRPGPSTEE